MTNLLIRPFFQARVYGSGFIFQFLILAMALLGTGIVLLLAHNHMLFPPVLQVRGFQVTLLSWFTYSLPLSLNP